MPIRKRPDLSARRQQYLGHSYWVVKEPVGLNYFRFQDEEYAILNMLDGNTSLDEIKDRFEAEFPPQKITLEELQQFLGMLHRSGLIVAGVGGQGHQLRKRRDERRRKEILGAASNILCIRFKGFDPERLLNWLYPYFKWFFSPITVFCCFLLAFSALSLVVVQFDVFRSRLPGFYQFFSPTNALLLAATLGVSKILHEFGHGLSCKHFGGECHEMGIMILVLTPCLYCNVSDSWMLPSKWKRAAIGAAGIYVEMLLASIATFVWWFTEPGLLNNICLNIIFISSVSTLLFNANPLLRYDGYYILADLVEIPNLRQKATTIFSRKMGEWLLGLEPPDDPFLPQRNQVFFVLYSCASIAYRWFILASILYFMYLVFKPYGLQCLGQVIMAMSLYGLVVMPLYKLFKFFYVPGRIEKVKKPRMYTSLAVIAALVLAFLFIPLPHSVMCVLEVQPGDAVPVYIDVPDGGQLGELFVKSGEVITAGQRLAQLENVDVDLEIEQLTGSLNQYREQLKSLNRQRFSDSQALGEIPQVKEALSTLESQLKQKTKDLARLNLVAPASGMVLPPPAKAKREDPEGQLSDWSGTPLERRNIGSYLQEGALFCQLGDPRQMEAILIIDQVDRNYVREGQTVEIKLDELPHDMLKSEVVEIAHVDLKIAPERLSTAHGGELPTVADPETGVQRVQSTSYQARAPLGLFGHGKKYEWLRGQIQQTGEDGARQIQYSPDNLTLDIFGGRVPVSDSAVRRCSPGEFVAVEGSCLVEVGGALTVEGTGRTVEISGRLPCRAAEELTEVDGTLLDAETGEPALLLEHFTANLTGTLADDGSSKVVNVSGELFSPELGQSTNVTGELAWDRPHYDIQRIRKLDPANALLRQGLRGRGKIHVAPIPLGTRLWRFISHTFNFKM